MSVNQLSWESAMSQGREDLARSGAESQILTEKTTGPVDSIL